MEIFSKFGIWESHVEEFISIVCSESLIKPELLKEWFHGEAMLLFQKKHRELYESFIEKYTVNNKKPLLQQAEMMDFKHESFKAIMPAFLEFLAAFSDNDSKSIDILVHQFKLFAVKAVSAHMDFYEIQAQVTNELNNYLEEPSETPKETANDFMQKKFLEYQQANPKLADEIQDHLQLQKEFVKYMSSKRSAVLQPNMNGSPVMFRTQQSPSPTPVERGRSFSIKRLINSSTS